MKAIRAIALTGAAVSALVLGGITPTFAATAQPQVGGLEGCLPMWHDNNTAGGWCDGTGPSSYQAWADCKDGTVATGVWRWDGDRR